MKPYQDQQWYLEYLHKKLHDENKNLAITTAKITRIQNEIKQIKEREKLERTNFYNFNSDIP